MTTASEEKAREEEVPSTPTPRTLRRQARTRASSVTPDAPTSLEAVTQRGVPLRKLAARTAAFLDRPGSLAHAHPHSFARARERHHEAANKHQIWAPLRVGRLIWGYLHLLLIKPALNFAEWATETPLRFFGVLALALVIWIWS